MDKLSEEPEDARFEITESLESLKSIYRENPSAFLLKIFLMQKTKKLLRFTQNHFQMKRQEL